MLMGYGIRIIERSLLEMLTAETGVALEWLCTLGNPYLGTFDRE